MELNEIIELWKQHNIDSVVFSFNCGGDSMGDTEIKIYSKTEVFSIENQTIHDYFDNEVYNNVDFYENSDGYYLGESGEVVITLNNDENDFDYSKSSTEEYSESVVNIIKIPLSNEEIEYINEYVQSINGSYSDDTNFNYKKDFIKNDNHIDLEKSISESITEICDGYTPEDINDVDEWYSYNTDNPLVFDGNNLVININNTYTRYN